MNISKMTGLLQVLANLGIVAGLVMVGLQMKQNEKLLKMELTNQYYANYIEMDTTLVGDSFYDSYKKAIEDPQNMTFADMRIMESQTFGPLTRWISAYRMYEKGLMDAEVWQSQVAMDAPYYYGDVYGRAWWEFYKNRLDQGFLPPEIKKAIDRELESSRPNNVVENYKGVQKIVNEILAEQELAKNSAQ